MQGESARLSRSDLLRRPDFWLVAIAAASMSAVGITAVTHLAALVMENGCTPEQATVLVVLFGAASTAGSLVFGWLSDRIPAALALVIDALVMALGWFVALGLSGMPLMVVSALAMGLAGGGVSTARNVLTRRLFGPASLGPALALAGLCALPLTFGFPPLAGYFRDLTGDYGLSGAAVIAGSLAAALAFLGLWFAKRRTGPVEL
jgi:MFS family permease